MNIASNNMYYKSGSKTWILLTLIALVLAALLPTAPASASEIHLPRLYARQQEGQPSRVSPSTPTGTNGNGDSSSSQPSSVPVPSSSSPPPSKQPGSSGGVVIGSGSSNSSTLPPLGSTGGTVIGTGGTIITGGTVVDPQLSVSRLSMVQPKQNSANPPLFPVGSYITFEWVFDNTTLVFVPATLTVEVSLTSNPKMVWPVANASGAATSVVWNTGAVVNPSLFMGFYTLYVTTTII
ncbi:hypothetical protein BGX21_011429 [Mortierella sp. AD011]|nr:hypothetical protein BGX20_009367 [Mortierella sp. AD010]KAF9390647.1 hypothetical protein BGX21_011429 [Mortierella sp. AD011]